MTEERVANAIDRRLGQRMRARRLEVGLSQERLADILGVTFQQVQKYEKGVNRVAASRLYEIATALEVPVAFFFDTVAPAPSAGGFARGVRETQSALAPETLASPEAHQLLTLFSAIRSAKVRRRVIELVRVLSEEDQG